MLSSSESTNCKVKLVAIAKDESAYFAEWLIHHLNCGFDAIDIYINRTTDNSLELLKKVSEAYPQVSFVKADWVDGAGPKAAERLQFIIYAMVLEELKNKGEYTHVCFLDIDEFWVHQGDQSNVKSFIDSFNPNDVVYLEWLVDFGRDIPFSLLSDKMEGYLSPLGKCIYPVGVSIDQVRLHISSFKNNQKVVLADNSEYQEHSEKQQALCDTGSSLKQSFVFHRANRSQMEYISLTLRGRPSSTFPFKENRNGLPDDQKQRLTVTLKGALYQNRTELFDQFLSVCNIHDDYHTAKAFVEARYNKTLEQVKCFVNDHYEVMLSIFAGVKDKHLTQFFTEYRRQQVLARPNDADLLRDLAVQAYHQDIDECVDLINQAKSLRPNGPMINKLRERYLLAQLAQKQDQSM
ncbi:glycosyltransferase family 2 protein [Glaciecola sp. KUL10]|uniref:glycosyltransferase family 2 protein n=1 Tax=Glaciecola sp. (strain KUL10) TaxID=2161813 RepID=UPI000D78A892|nr:glycosyltransferase family 2 protein [Glaciecola sp. KUL10]GBL04159.1 hypothetical protein KUL10_14650 [Glaciecola sp. KUL10]